MGLSFAICSAAQYFQLGTKTNWTLVCLHVYILLDVCLRSLSVRMARQGDFS
jgi:hypothetical protein